MQLLAQTLKNSHHVKTLFYLNLNVKRATKKVLLPMTSQLSWQYPHPPPCVLHQGLTSPNMVQAKKVMLEKTKEPYPHNTLRNYALDYLGGDFFVAVDVLILIVCRLIIL